MTINLIGRSRVEVELRETFNDLSKILFVFLISLPEYYHQPPIRTYQKKNTQEYKDLLTAEVLNLDKRLFLCSSINCRDICLKASL